MGKRNLNLELFVVVSWMNSWVSPFIIPDIICFGFFTLDTRMVKFFMKLGVKFHSFFLEKKGEIFVPFTLFEKWKWNENDWKSRSRSESEIKMTRDRDREVKFQKKSREFSRIETLAGHCLSIGVPVDYQRESKFSDIFLAKQVACWIRLEVLEVHSVFSPHQRDFEFEADWILNFFNGNHFL